MPDLASRDAHERRITAAMVLLFDEAPDDFFTKQRFPYKQFYSTLGDTLRPLLAEVHSEAATSLAASRGVTLTKGAADRRAATWAERYADRVAKQIATTTDQAIRRARRSQATEEILARLQPLFGRAEAERIADRGPEAVNSALRKAVPDSAERSRILERAKAEAERSTRDRVRPLFQRPRAENISVTNTTAAINQGERGSLDEIREKSGLVMREIWRIEDRDACEICRGYEGTTRSIWGRQFPLGPPAHNHCRCGIEYGEPYRGSYRIPDAREFVNVDAGQ